MANSITDLPEPPAVDRHRRMVRYAIAQLVRVACFVGAVFATGWWQLVLVIAAVLLPYVAVVVANAASNTSGPAVEAPGQAALPTSDPDEPRGMRDLGSMDLPPATGSGDRADPDDRA